MCKITLPPHFLIIGFPKCGTSFLFDLLCQHPNIVNCYKEPKFFRREHDNEEEAYKKAYKNWFSEQEKHPDIPLLIGDGTPEYVYERKYLERIKERCSSSLIVALVREPVARVYSNFLQISGLRNKYEFNSYVERYLYSGKKAAHRNFLFHWSRYEQYLPMVFELFPETLLIKSEDLFLDPQKYSSLIFSRLGIKNIECSENKAQRNSTQRFAGKITDLTCKTLNDYYKETRKYMHETHGIEWKEYSENFSS